MDNLLFHPRNLHRKRIEEILALAEAEEIPLIIMVAPMGYGKTSVIRDFLKKKERGGVER